VHPATGYQLCRMLAAAPKVADALITAHREKRTPDAAARAAYAAVWSRETVLQREFALFGGEFLLTLGAKDLRAWFAAFFAVDEDVWGGFLGGWPGLPGNHHHETRLGRSSTVWKSNIGRPTSMRCCILSCICSMASSFQAIDAILSP
jgi:lycopene beta-cyclase